MGATSLGDVAAVVLVVGVGVDDHVGAELEPRVKARLKARGQTLVVGQLDDVVDAVVPRDVDGGVAGAVVDDQPFHLVDALDLARQVRQRLGQLRFLVETRDLDDQLHGPGATPDRLKSRLAVDVPASQGSVGARCSAHGSGILVDEDGDGHGKHARATPSA
jgi:hypothetical protein